MQTEEFERALEELISLSAEYRTAVMCAEALHWRCHRSLIADALAVRGFAVGHIANPARAEPHRLTTWARVEGTDITYPAEADNP